jgi:hypothetical protein
MGRVIRGLIAGRRQEMSLLQKRSWLALGCTQLPVHWVMGVPFPGVNVWGEADGLPPSSAEVKNGWSSTSFHSVFIQSMNRDIFTFLIYKRQVHVECKFKIVIYKSFVSNSAMIYEHCCMWKCV